MEWQYWILHIRLSCSNTHTYTHIWYTINRLHIWYNFECFYNQATTTIEFYIIKLTSIVKISYSCVRQSVYNCKIKLSLIYTHKNVYTFNLIHFISNKPNTHKEYEFKSVLIVCDEMGRFNILYMVTTFWIMRIRYVRTLRSYVEHIVIVIVIVIRLVFGFFYTNVQTILYDLTANCLVLLPIQNRMFHPHKVKPPMCIEWGDWKPLIVLCWVSFWLWLSTFYRIRFIKVFFCVDYLSIIELRKMFKICCEKLSMSLNDLEYE